MASAPPLLIKRGRNQVVRFPIPLPHSIKCGHKSCEGETGNGPWSGEGKHNRLFSHINDRHRARGDNPPAIFFCEKCHREFSSFASAGRHAKNCSDIINQHLLSSLELTIASEGGRISLPSTSGRESMAPKFEITRISGSKLVLIYPGKPSRCSLCEWVTTSSLCRAMQSMHRHMEVEHSIRLEKFWACSICGLEGTGTQLNCHFKKCLSSRASSSAQSDQMSVSNISTSMHGAQSQVSPLAQGNGEASIPLDPNESWLHSINRQSTGVNESAEISDTLISSHHSPSASHLPQSIHSQPPVASPFTLSPLIPPLTSGSPHHPPKSPTPHENPPQSPAHTSSSQTTIAQTPEQTIAEPAFHQPSSPPLFPINSDTSPSSPAMSKSSSSDESEDVSEHSPQRSSQRDKNFFRLWENAFRECDTMADLNDVLGVGTLYCRLAG
jgi:hypothetical protein